MGSQPRCLATAFDHCYTSESGEMALYVADTWFLAVVELVEMCLDAPVQQLLPQLLHLLLYQIGKAALPIR